MKVELNKQGLFVLTAETKQDNMVLFSITNNDTITGIQLRYSNEPVTVQTEPKKGRGIYDRSQIKKKPMKYLKDCPIEGCGERVRGIRVHMHKRHGVKRDGEVEDFFLFNGEKIEVKKPVVKLPDGTYRVRPVPSLLD